MSGVITVLSGGSSSQVDEPNSTQIKINLNIEYEDCRFEMNEGSYVVHIEGRVKPLTTAICKYSRYLPQLLATGGTVMGVCYGLYKLGFSAGNFSRGSLGFELKIEQAKLATIRRQITKGRFVESLQDEVDAIIEEHQSTLPNLKKFTIQSATEVSMKETDKQSGIADVANLNPTELVPHASNHTHSSIKISIEFSCNPERTCNVELHQGVQQTPSSPSVVSESKPYADSSNSRKLSTDAPTEVADNSKNSDRCSKNGSDKSRSSGEKYHVGIFAHDHDKEKADRIKGHCDSLGYNTCIYEEWVGVEGEPILKKFPEFVKECLVLFWIASPQHTTESYMEQWENIANDIAIESNNSRFVVVIPKEFLQQPCEKIIPAELMANEPVKEDTKIIERIKATVEAVQATTTNPPPTNDSQNITITSSQPSDVPGITNIVINLYGGSRVESIFLQTQGKSDAKPNEG